MNVLSARALGEELVGDPATHSVRAQAAQLAAPRALGSAIALDIEWATTTMCWARSSAPAERSENFAR